MIATLTRTRKAFSLVELVIVIVIIGIISAIAIPRMSRGSEGAADNALRGDLAVLRSAIELFAAEHEGVYPTAATFEAQMTGTTNLAGTAGSAAEHIYGPYLKEVPALKVGTNKGDNGVATADGVGIGWIYNDTTHEIVCNLPVGETDAAGVPYNTY